MDPQYINFGTLIVKEKGLALVLFEWQKNAPKHFETYGEKAFYKWQYYYH